VGADGPTHHGAFDLSYLRCIPNMTVMAPSDENECRQMLYTAFTLDTPSAVRYPRGAGPGVVVQQETHALPVGRAITVGEGFQIENRIVRPSGEVRHLQNLVDMEKDKTYDYSGRGNASEARFASGECAIFLTSSGYYGTVKGTAKFDFTSAPMPYYPDAPGAPQNSIIGGASLWVMGGKKPEEYKGVAKFFTFLSDTNRQVYLHEESGYLPITKAAYEKTKADGFYQKNPVLETPLKELTNKEPTENSRGLRFGNMVQMRDIWAEEIEAALAGQKTAQEALDAAVARGNTMLRTFEKTAK